MAALADPKKELFAQLVAKGIKDIEAVYTAGWTPPHRKSAANKAQRLKRDLEVKARISDLKEKTHLETIDNLGFDRQWVMKSLKKNVETATRAIPVTDRYGHSTGEYKQELGAANRALELVGKEFGMFADRVVFDNLDEHLEGLTEKDLRTFVRQAASEVGLRVVDMNDDETRHWILRNAARVGLTVEGGCEDPGSAEASEDQPVHALPETAGVPRPRIH